MLRLAVLVRVTTVAISALSPASKFGAPIPITTSIHTADAPGRAKRLGDGGSGEHAPPSCAAVEEGVDCGNATILPAGKNPVVSTAAACCAFCQLHNATCRAWTWNKSGNKMCYIKASCADPVAAPNVVSGGAPPPPPGTTPCTAGMCWNFTYTCRVRNFLAGRCLLRFSYQWWSC